VSPVGPYSVEVRLDSSDMALRDAEEKCSFYDADQFIRF
jgi:hypothetical protein